MDLKKLVPWNWFKKEQEQEAQTHTVPVQRQDLAVRHDHPLFQLHTEIDRLFDRAFQGFRFPSWMMDSSLVPSVRSEWLKPTLDLAATEREYTISLELPGVEAGDVRLEIMNDTLKISGEKRQEKEEKDKDFYRMERSYGSFQRVLSLPEDADQDSINAVFKNGVMTITVPRKSVPQADVKQIEIKTS